MEGKPTPSKGRKISRRQFLSGIAIGAAGMALCPNKSVFASTSRSSAKIKPNLLFIHTDQHHFEAISGLGCRHVRTPNIDRLMSRGTTFTQSYSANPVCCPARACWYTGRPSSENGVMTNAHTIVPDMPDLGQWFGAHGYTTSYSGKWHVPGRDAYKSFNVLAADPSGLGEHSDSTISISAESFLRSYSGEKPFFLSLGFMQPHDVCFWVFGHKDNVDSLPKSLNPADMPELPPNFRCNCTEPESFAKWLKETGPRNASDRMWNELTWRYYLWSYYRMVEMADAEIGRVLDALEESEFASNTIVVFTADHGDGLARHELVSKMFLYDEAARVPFVISCPDRIPAGKVDKSHLVSGLDIAPTLCDFADIPTLPKARGLSIKQLLDCRHTDWRDILVSESSVTGRMVRTPEYKLITYHGDTTDQLFDMRADPGETRNLAHESHYSDTVSSLKRSLEHWESKLVLVSANIRPEPKRPT
ncbi:MAG: sulfatase family protein [Armatimonadota bacterium]